jgi:hypothetical protein
MSRGVARNVSAEEMERRLRGIREEEGEGEEDEGEEGEEGGFDAEGFDEEAVRGAIMEQVLGASMQTDDVDADGEQN